MAFIHGPFFCASQPLTLTRHHPSHKPRHNVGGSPSTMSTQEWEACVCEWEGVRETAVELQAAQ